MSASDSDQVTSAYATAAEESDSDVDSADFKTPSASPEPPSRPLANPPASIDAVLRSTVASRPLPRLDFGPRASASSSRSRERRRRTPSREAIVISSDDDEDGASAQVAKKRLPFSSPGAAVGSPPIARKRRRPDSEVTRQPSGKTQKVGDEVPTSGTAQIPDTPSRVSKTAGDYFGDYLSPPTETSVPRHSLPPVGANNYGEAVKKAMDRVCGIFLKQSRSIEHRAIVRLYAQSSEDESCRDLLDALLRTGLDETKPMAGDGASDAPGLTVPQRRDWETFMRNLTPQMPSDGIAVALPKFDNREPVRTAPPPDDAETGNRSSTSLVQDTRARLREKKRASLLAALESMSSRSSSALPSPSAERDVSDGGESRDANRVVLESPSSHADDARERTPTSKVAYPSLDSTTQGASAVNGMAAEAKQPEYEIIMVSSDEESADQISRPKRQRRSRGNGQVEVQDSVESVSEMVDTGAADKKAHITSAESTKKFVVAVPLVPQEKLTAMSYPNINDDKSEDEQPSQAAEEPKAQVNDFEMEIAAEMVSEPSHESPDMQKAPLATKRHTQAEGEEEEPVTKRAVVIHKAQSSSEDADAVASESSDDSSEASQDSSYMREVMAASQQTTHHRATDDDLEGEESLDKDVDEGDEGDAEEEDEDEEEAAKAAAEDVAEGDAEDSTSESSDGSDYMREVMAASHRSQRQLDPQAVEVISFKSTEDEAEPAAGGAERLDESGESSDAESNGSSYMQEVMAASQRSFQHQSDALEGADASEDESENDLELDSRPASNAEESDGEHVTFTENPNKFLGPEENVVSIQSSHAEMFDRPDANDVSKDPDRDIDMFAQADAASQELKGAQPEENSRLEHSRPESPELDGEYAQEPSKLRLVGAGLGNNAPLATPSGVPRPASPELDSEPEPADVTMAALATAQIPDTPTSSASISPSPPLGGLVVTDGSLPSPASIEPPAPAEPTDTPAQPETQPGPVSQPSQRPISSGISKQLTKTKNVKPVKPVPRTKKNRETLEAKSTQSPGSSQQHEKMKKKFTFTPKWAKNGPTAPRDSRKDDEAKQIARAVKKEKRRRTKARKTNNRSQSQSEFPDKSARKRVKHAKQLESSQRSSSEGLLSQQRSLPSTDA